MSRCGGMVLWGSSRLQGGAGQPCCYLSIRQLGHPCYTLASLKRRAMSLSGGSPSRMYVRHDEHKAHGYGVSCGAEEKPVPAATSNTAYAGQC